MLIDNGCSMDILFYDSLLKMNILLEWLERVDASITGFSREPVSIEGIIVLLVIAGWAPRCSQVHLAFMIVKIPSTYNVILGRLGLNVFYTVVSIYYLLIKFPTIHGVGEVYRNQTLARQCYLVFRWIKSPSIFLVKGLNTIDELTEERGELAKDLLTIPLNAKNPQHIIQIGSTPGKVAKW